uniref:Ankyrin repeat domain 10a n=1 Tax=Erpetoichthys calabaricus TaxID=27687 RepID=A0A8C4RWM8_ERPCA
MMSVCLESGFSSEEVLSVRFPLHRACRDGDVGALCALLQRCETRADLSAEDSFYGWTPIHWAAHFGKLECVMRLVQVGTGINTMTTRFAQTPAHIAAFGGHPECLLWLVQTGADINRQDYVGETPIHKAARAGSVDCVKILLKYGAKADLRNASGLTAADLAHAQGFQECAEVLSNVQNQLNQLNGFITNGVLNGIHSESRTNFTGGPRKRSLEYPESNLVKKARTDADREMSLMYRNGEDELEAMHTDSDPANSSGAQVAGVVSYKTYLGKALENGFLANGVLFEAGSNSNEAKQGADIPLVVDNGWTNSAGESHGADMCGSLHLGGSPSSCVPQRPTWVPSDLADTLHYGHFHGFGDTAESIPEASSLDEHCTSIKAEQRYDNAVYSALHMFHGS